ncbi:hypothetical protein COB64_04080 [Candidatus Wolfebacteria bacterium]|nr:MAG: hypothetical protein COB64_04080 [Candidatus Wolfebacteria bacterium]
MKKSRWIFILILALFALYIISRDSESPDITVDTGTELEELMMDAVPSVDPVVVDTTGVDMEAIEYQYSGTISDVTGGETITGINTGGNSSGFAQVGYDGSKYSLRATFENLPDPQGTDFYEGWVVRKNPFDVISTGVVEKIDGTYINTYMSEKDLTDHNFYVLTIEPDDGDPAPAEHIAEGTLTK